MTDKTRLVSLKEEFLNELTGNILHYWSTVALDTIHGGFAGEVSNDNRINEQADKGGILNARILWTFSSCYRVLGNDNYLKMADRAYEYLVNHFIDTEFGGSYWSVDALGNPRETRKQTYAIAFAIYGLSEYARIRPGSKAISIALSLMEDIENHAFDTTNNGYLEAFDRTWHIHADQRLSAIDMNEKKSMNTHLHVIEAYTNLYRVTGDDALKARVENLLDIFTRYIIHPINFNFQLFFDERWIPQSKKISFGHDIEGSWLLLETAEAIGSEQWTEKTGSIALKMAGVSRKGIDADGGLLYEKVPGEEPGKDKEWWTLAEAVVGFYNAWQLSGDNEYLNASEKMWKCIKANFIDRKYGEWFYRVDANHRPVESYNKVSLWKCPYHNARMCLEMMRRIDLQLIK
jgi:cellobiose epimerase